MLWPVCLVLLGIYALFCWRNREFNKIAKRLPSNLKRVPILEHSINFMGNAKDRMRGLKLVGEDAIKNKEGMVSLWLAHKFFVIIADPDSAEVVSKMCLEKDDLMKFISVLIGNGSIFAPVKIWRPRRKILAPNFGTKTLNSFVKIFSNQAAILTEQLKCAVGNGNVSLFEKVTKYSMDSVCETALGIKVNSQSIPNHPIPEAFYQFCNKVSYRLVKPWLYYDLIYKFHWHCKQVQMASNLIQQYVSKIIKSKRLSMKEQKTTITENKSECSSNSDQDSAKPKSFLEILIESGGDKGFTDLELQEETLVMLLAGTDTSSVAVSFTALMLAKHPDVQDKVYQEIEEVIGNTERSIESNDLPKLKYLEAVVKESLRLYPPVPVVVRKVDKNITLPSGIILTKGVCALIHIWAIHRNPKYWGLDANQFKPDRFLEGPLSQPLAFMPFSSGPRMCLGYQFAMMSIKTVMAHLLRRYRILSAKMTNGVNDNMEFDDDDLPVTFEIMMKHAGNFELQLELRNLLLQICLLLVGTCAIYIYRKNRANKFHEIYKQCPTKARRVPILEHAVNFMGSAEDRMKSFQKMGQEAIYDYKGNVSFWIGPKFFVMIGDGVDADMIAKTFLEKGDLMKLSKRLIGSGSLFSPAAIWRPRRRAIAPNFGLKTLNSYVKIFSRQSQILVEQLEKAIGNGDFSIFEKVTKYSIDTLCETAFGVEMKTQSIPKHPAIHAFYRFCDVAIRRILTPWLHPDFIYRWHKDYPDFESNANILQEYVGQIVKAKRQDINERKQNNEIQEQDETTVKSLLENLIETGENKGFNDTVLQEEILVVMLAGTDTSSASISFIMLLLAKHPDIQEKVYQEIKDVIGTKSHVEASDLPKLKYLEAVIKEGLRLYPTVPIIARNVDRDITLPSSGMKLVSGVGAMLNIWAIHRNPRHWGPDVKQFRPERFLEGLEYPAAFFPFSTGPRNCIGYQYGVMSMKTVMATMLRRYKVIPATGVTIDHLGDDDIPLIIEVTLKHKDDFMIQLEHRK
ncbi:uncharacterized protein LOC128670917 [Plodia interpunctella]|uniref:uncharacterized protein LOC128670917 n=1 Tax=Plodia interpunctella TaxID=58824 RepID=UPI002368B8A5|nr:uncharacterized protein LOC128670917 [Plodia interpunctella]